MAVGARPPARTSVVAQPNPRLEHREPKPRRDRVSAHIAVLERIQHLPARRPTTGVVDLRHVRPPDREADLAARVAPAPAARAYRAPPRSPSAVSRQRVPWARNVPIRP